MWPGKMIQHRHHRLLLKKKKRSQLRSNSLEWSNLLNQQEAVMVAEVALGEVAGGDVASILHLVKFLVDMTMQLWRILEETSREILGFEAVRAMAGSQSGVAVLAGEAETVEGAGEEAINKYLNRASGAATEAGAVHTSSNLSLETSVVMTMMMTKTMAMKVRVKVTFRGPLVRERIIIKVALTMLRINKQKIKTIGISLQ